MPGAGRCAREAHGSVFSQAQDAISVEILQRRLDIFYRSGFAASIAIAVSVTLVSALVWTADRAGTVIAWWAVALGACLLRLVAIGAYFRCSGALRRRYAYHWYLLMVLIASAIGAIWGSAGFLLLGSEDLFNQLLLFLVLAGVASGATISLAAFYSAGVLFLITMVLPFVLRIFTLDMDRSPVLAALVLLYLAIMLVLARLASRNLIDNLEMAYLRSQAEDQVRQQAFFDALTGLPNRRLLQDRLEQALARARRGGQQVVLLFLDLDHFKRVNDSLGHHIGDKLLATVAWRLRELLRENDTAARLGGDEFVVLLTDMPGSRHDAVGVAQRRGEELLRAIEEPMMIEGNHIQITASIGASLLPEDTADFSELMSHADTAMYSAKDDGRNTLHFFEDSMQEVLNARLALETNLRSALDEGGLELYLQPQYHQDAGLSGAELLLRWHHEGAYVSPGSFIPVAEDSGLILRLGDWVIRESCRLASRLVATQTLPANFTLAINVSPRQFRQADFSDRLLAALRAHDLPPGLIELELTENLLIDDIDDTAAKMLRLRESGVRFSIDDFGTGYSSLFYLKSLPLDVLKIDQSFVRDLLTDPGDASIVRAIISMAASLGIDVIAEGVENEAVREILVGAGCRRFQGFHFAAALPYADFCALLGDGGGADNVPDITAAYRKPQRGPSTP